jgi:hypothetical protein
MFFSKEQSLVEQKVFQFMIFRKKTFLTAKITENMTSGAILLAKVAFCTLISSFFLG